MTADISTDLSTWSTTAASNQPDYSDSVGPNNLADNLRALQAAIRTVYSADVITAAATTNLATKQAGVITVSGTTGITSFGTVTQGIVKILIFDSATPITYNAGTMILPTGASITTAANDVAIMVSLGAGGWRCVSYMRGTGSPLGASALLSSIGAASAAATIANGDYAIAWNWALTTASESAMKIGETTAATGGSGAQYLFDVGTALNSTAIPFRVSHWGTTDSLLVSRLGAVSITAKSGQAATITSPTSISLAGGLVSITSAASSVSLTAATNLYLTSGASSNMAFNAHGADRIVMQSYGTVYGGNTMYPQAAKVFVMDDAASPGFRPVLTSGFGTGATIKGTDVSCTINIGSGASTSMVLTFDEPFSPAPAVFVSSDQAGITFSADSTTTTVTITASSGMTSGKRLFLFIVGTLAY